VPDLLLELPDGDIAPLLAHLDGAVFVNLSPGVEADEVPPPTSPMGGLFGSRGPLVPLATWTPGEIGLQHGVGARVTKVLAEQGVTVPDEWYVASEHPRRGLVLKTYQAAPPETLGWLVRAARALCPVAIPHPWQAVVRTRT
jgi:hypothetical protein